ncbi:hypothetical protein GBF38_021278 [Nibea albiflora]|uniref:Uncharacterized protein n=1 Tax=Nibea albiflora TaxID=240163 RepID=A0ACB7FFI8_NIBAL|nr:hypothetical protein GBF38_021278 [Nibea albiflora]
MTVTPPEALRHISERWSGSDGCSTEQIDPVQTSDRKKRNSLSAEQNSVKATDSQSRARRVHRADTVTSFGFDLRASHRLALQSISTADDGLMVDDGCF